MPILGYERKEPIKPPSQIEVLTEKIASLDIQITDLIIKRDALVDSRAALLNTGEIQA